MYEQKFICKVRPAHTVYCIQFSLLLLMNIVYTQKDFETLTGSVTQCVAEMRHLRAKNMQRCSTGCRLLLVTPVFFILLQVAFALHHHHFESYHDDRDVLHSISTMCYPDHVKQDTLICLASKVPVPSPPSITILSPDSPKAPVTILITDPSQSRAPPSTQPS